MVLCNVTCTIEQPSENIYTKFDSSIDFNICLLYTEDFNAKLDH
jgi:hypothetical protein